MVLSSLSEKPAEIRSKWGKNQQQAKILLKRRQPVFLIKLKIIFDVCPGKIMLAFHSD